MMINAVAASTTRIGASAENSEGPAARAYRIRKSFAVVHFEQTVDLSAKGRIVFLPEGAELRVIGSSCMSGCFEVLCQNRLYNIFKEDLLGPWSSLIKSSLIKPSPIKSRPIKLVRAMEIAAKACA
jgi:hypothetical protein